MAFIQPKLINADIDTSNIASYSESPDFGNVFNALAGYAQKAEQVKKKREVSKINNDIIQQNQEFDAKFLSDPTVYQDEVKYAAMIEAKDGLIKQQKDMLITSEFLGEDELTSFNSSINQMAGEFTVKTMGKRNEIFLKDTIDETTIEVQRGQTLAINANSSEERNAILKNTANSINSLDALGVGVAQQEKMVSDLHLGIISSDIDKVYKDIITNDNINDKTAAFEDAFANMTDEATLESRIQAVSKASPLTDTDEYREGLRGKAKKMIQDDYLTKKEGALNKTEEWASKVRDEEYKFEMKTLEAQNGAMKAYDTKITAITTNLSSGNQVLAISRAEGVPLKKGDLARQPELATNYYGNSMDKLVDNDTFIPEISSTEINGYKNFDRTQTEQGSSRSEIINETISRLGEFDYDYEEKNAMLQLVDSKIITQTEYRLLNQGYSSELIDTLRVGEKSNKARNIMYSEVDPKHAIYGAFTKLRTSDPNTNANRERQVSNVMIGLIQNGEIEGYPLEQGYSSSVFREQYQRNSEFKRHFDEQIEVFKGMNQVKTRKAKLKTKYLYSRASVDKPVSIRKTSEEKRGETTPKIKTGETVQVGRQKKSIVLEDSIF